MPATQTVVALEPHGFDGQNTVLNPATLPLESQAQAKNAIMREIGTIGKRDGSIPVTATALGETIDHLTSYKSSPNATPALIAASGTSLYKFDGTDTLDEQTMTDALNTSDIYTVDFTNSLLTSRMIIGDGADLKGYDGTTVADITPAADDPSPAPPNGLTDINVKGHKYVWSYSYHVFSSPGNNEVYYSKRFEYDYWPTTQFFYLVRENDYVNGPGVAFDNVLIVPMRRSWSIISGTTFDDFDASRFLNTSYGVIAPRSIETVTYPNGEQTIVFLSDDGAHEVFISVADGNSKVYATRSLMKDQIDFTLFTDAEKATAYGKFDADNNCYRLYIKSGDDQFVYVMDTRNRKWYVWTHPWDVKPSIRFDEVTYFAGSTGHLHKYDEDLYTDWNESTQDTGTAVDFDVYGPLVAFEFSGYSSYLDYFMVEAKQWTVTATLDVSIVYGADVKVMESALKNQIFTWGVTPWGEAQWANLNYTDILNQAKRLIIKKKGFYFQRRFRNNRDEPVLIYKERYMGRLSGR
jgi:hypothetical protein